jgi:cytochrome c peroxidase
MKHEFAIWISGVVLVLGLVSATGCDQEGPFTNEELRSLQPFRLASTLAPHDDSNSFAEDPQAAQLGKKLFYDARVGGTLGSYNDGTSNGSLGKAGETGRIACASCHQLDTGGSDHRSGGATSLGANYSERNAPSVINAAFSLWQFWDGRKDSLWSQALSPTENEVEGNGSRLVVAHLIYDNYKSDYEGIFGPMPSLTDHTRFPAAGKPGDAAFDGMADADKEAVNRVFANFGKAVAAYERRLTSLSFARSAFDRYLDGDQNAMSPAAIRGAKIFIGKASCNECHSGPFFSDFRFHNIGCPQQGDHVPESDDGRFLGLSMAKEDPFNRAGAFSDHPATAHLDSVLSAGLKGEFKTPTLRNVTKTAPYMHDGVYQNLWDVVNHYNFGGGTGRYAGERSPTLVPLLLAAREVDDLIEFLDSLGDGAPLPSEFPEGLIAPPPPAP